MCTYALISLLNSLYSCYHFSSNHILDENRATFMLEAKLELRVRLEKLV